MRRNLIRISGVLLLLVLPLFSWRMYLAHVVNRQVAELRAAGFPTNGEELNRWYAAIPKQENAAIALAQAFQLRRTYSDSRSNLVNHFKLPKHGERLSPEQTKLLKGYITLNAACFEKVDEALKRPNCRYPIDFTKLMDTPLPHLAELKNIALLHQYAAFVKMETGNAPFATSNIVAMLALARTLDTEPCLISQLMRLKLIDMAFTTLERRANAGAFSPAEVSQLVAAFAQTRTAGMTIGGLIGDRALTMPYFRMTRSEYQTIHPPKEGDESKPGSPLPCNGPVILKLIGYYKLDYGSYLIALNKGLALLSNAPPDNLRARAYFARVSEESGKRGRTLSSLTLASFSGVPWRENEGVVSQRLALAALAVERFRNDNERLPEGLGELAPKYLAVLPEDPFTGLQLKYRRKAQGYVIYGEDHGRRDIDGLKKVETRQNADKSSRDITFTVER